MSLLTSRQPAGFFLCLLIAFYYFNEIPIFKKMIVHARAFTNCTNSN